MFNVGQEIISEGFRARLDVWGKTIWVGSPKWQSARALIEQINELDPDFELVRDIREACRMHIESPAPDIKPTDIIHQGESALHPEARWKVIPGSRKNNPIDPIQTWIVQKVI